MLILSDHNCSFYEAIHFLHFIIWKRNYLQGNYIKYFNFIDVLISYYSVNQFITLKKEQ